MRTQRICTVALPTTFCNEPLPHSISCPSHSRAHALVHRAVCVSRKIERKAKRLNGRPQQPKTSANTSVAVLLHPPAPRHRTSAECRTTFKIKLNVLAFGPPCCLHKVFYLRLSAKGGAASLTGGANGHVAERFERVCAFSS